LNSEADSTESQPAWEHSTPLLSIRLLFAEPYWISANPAHVGARWIRAMSDYIEDDKGRRIWHGVIRKLDATPNATALGLSPASDCRLSLLVRNIATGETIAPEQYRALPGFEGRPVWNFPGVPAAPALQASAPPVSRGSCCGNK
jgi:hypothetical protein